MSPTPAPAVTKSPIKRRITLAILPAGHGSIAVALQTA